MLLSCLAFSLVVIVANRLGILMAKVADDNDSFRHGLARWIMIVVPLACLTVAFTLGDKMDDIFFHFGMNSAVSHFAPGLLLGFAFSIVVFPWSYYGMRQYK